MFTKFTNGAEQEVEEVYRYETGAEVEAEAVYKYKDGAEEEVWCAVEIMTEVKNTISNGSLEVNGKTQLYYNKFYINGEGSLTGSGVIEFRLEGDWTNPLIKFDWHGGLMYWNSSYTQAYRKQAGTIKLWYKLANGSTYTIDTVVGTEDNASGGIMEDMGTFNRTINGNVVEVGIIIDVLEYTVQYTEADLIIVLESMTIDGKKIGFPADSAFDKQIW